MDCAFKKRTMIYVRISRNLYNLEKVVGLKVVFLLRNAQFGSGFMPLNALDGSAIQALITILKLIFILLNFLKCFTCLCVCVCILELCDCKSFQF